MTVRGDALDLIRRSCRFCLPVRRKGAVLHEERAADPPIPKNLGNPLACSPISIGIDRCCHAAVSVLVLDEFCDMSEDGVWIGADDAREPGFGSLWPFGRVAKHENRD